MCQWIVRILLALYKLDRDGGDSYFFLWYVYIFLAFTAFLLRSQARLQGGV